MWSPLNHTSKDIFLIIAPNKKQKKENKGYEKTLVTPIGFFTTCLQNLLRNFGQFHSLFWQILQMDSISVNWQFLFSGLFNAVLKRGACEEQPVSGIALREFAIQFATRIFI